MPADRRAPSSPRSPKGRGPAVIRVRIGPGEAGRRLDAVVGESVSRILGHALTKSAVRRLIMAGVVSLEGRPLRAPGRELPAGGDLVLHIHPDRLRSPARPGETDPLADVDFVVTTAAVLFEDEALIAVDKPAGLPTVPTADPSRPSLVRAVEAFLARAGRAPQVLGVHQRLDRDTSGVVLFAKDPRANPGLADAFSRREVEKVYDAVSARPAADPARSFEIARALAPRGRSGMQGVARGGLPALTEVVVRETLPGALLLEARPRTGRKHQIRVHLAEAGMPILGDVLYGPASRSASGPAMAARAARSVGRLMLHARRLALRHPLSGEPLVIESPWPEAFRRTVEELRVAAAPGSRLRDGGAARGPRWRSAARGAPRSRARAGAPGGQRR